MNIDLQSLKALDLTLVVFYFNELQEDDEHLNQYRTSYLYGEHTDEEMFEYVKESTRNRNVTIVSILR